MVPNNAFLVRVSISMWNARKMDKAATREARERANADAKAGVRVYKTALAADALEHIESIANAARIEHRKRTVPWAYDGPGAITAEGYPAYKARMAEFEREFHDGVAAFLRVYDEERESARTYLGSLFNPADYPEFSTIGSKFAFSVSAEPMPQPDAFRVQGLAPAAVAEIKADMADKLVDAVENANKTAWGRVLEHVEKLKLRLDGYKPKGPGQNKVEGKFHDSVVDNIAELVTLLPSINIANDPDLTRIGQKLTALTAYSGDDLRASESLRQEIAKQASAVMEQIGVVFRNMPKAA